MNPIGFVGGNVGGPASEILVSAQPPLQSESGETDNLIEDMWANATQDIINITPETENWKIQPLPLARIKKIMKSEEFVMQELEKDRCQREGIELDEKTTVKFMISAEAPLVMSKACELLIRELSVRAWQHTSRNRRRTLQRQDIHAAVGESDVYDFLIDIVPRVATHRLPAPNAIPVDMTQMNQTLMVQNFGLPTGQVNLGLPTTMLQHHGSVVGASGQADINTILDHHQQMHPEQLMLAFPNQLSALSTGMDGNGGQQQHQLNNGVQQLPQQLLQQQQALMAARMQQRQHQADNQPPQWPNP